VETTKFEERLRRIMQAAGAKTDTELAKALGIKPPSVAAARKRAQIPSGWVEQVAEQSSVDADWLLFGESPKRRSRKKWTAGEIELVGVEEVGKVLDELTNLPVTDSKRTVPLKPYPALLCDVDMVYVPLVKARLSAGTGSFETDGESEKRYGFRNDFLTRKGQPSNMVLMRVVGDSMEPNILHDDVVLVDQSQTTPTPGALFAVGIMDMVYIKMVDALPGRIILKSSNSEYGPIEIDARGDLVDGIRIIGKAVWLGRELR
jgi:phage repressor protein C with HTH and peptisase S24 domain